MFVALSDSSQGAYVLRIELDRRSDLADTFVGLFSRFLTSRFSRLLRRAHLARFRQKQFHALCQRFVTFCQPVESLVDRHASIINDGACNS
jgi:hypothetical protein